MKYLFLALVFVAGAPLFKIRAQATFSESPISQTLYASPTGVSGNSGLSPASPKNLNGAIASAATTASKVILLDGDYRQWVTLPGGNSLLIIEAQNPGQAAITGSDRVTNWADVGGGLYTLPWILNWGLANTGFSGTWTAYNRRMEMLFIDGTRLLQKCDPSGNAVATNTLNPGEFTVNETSNIITFRPPSGVILSGASKVEVSTRGNSDHLFQSSGRSNLVLRGLVFRHHAGAINNRFAFRLQGSSGTSPATQIRIEDCAFVQNNGVALELHNTADFSLTRVSASNNGARGAGGIGLRRGRITDSEFSFNNWRTAIVNTGHDAGGVKLFDGQLGEYTVHTISDLVFLRCTFRSNNAVAFWQDYGGKDVTIDSCLFENNEQGAIMQEMSPGPFTIKNSVIRNNGVWGIQSYGSPNVAITNNFIYSTRPGPAYQSDPQYCALINVVLDNRQSTGLIGTNPSAPSSAFGHFRGWTITGNTIQATHPGGAPIFYATDYGDSTNPNYPAKTSLVASLISNNNRWWRAAGNGMFSATDGFFSATVYGNGWQNAFSDSNFTSWKNATGQDAQSTWGAVDLTSVPDPTVAAVPVVAPGQSVSTTVGTALNYQISASRSPSAYALVSGTLPAGVSLNTSNGIISGTPSTAGTFTPAFNASNSVGTSPAVIITLNIIAPPAPILSAGQSAVGTAAVPFTYQIAASGSPTSFSLTTGNLPSGITLNSTTGQLSGTPNQVGTFSPTFTATNAGGSSPAVALTIVINAAPAPVINAGQIANGFTNSAFSYQILAQGNPMNFSIVTGSLPTGILLDSATGLLSGTTTVVGTFTPTFTASGAAGTSPATVVTIQIEPPTPAALLLYDSFSGSTVSFGGGGWQPWSNWNGSVIFGSGLDYLSLLTSGQSLVNTDQYGGVGREFPTLSSGVIWFSWLQNNAAATNRAARVDFMKEGSTKFRIGQNKNETATNFFVYDASGVRVVDTGRSNNGTNFVAGSIDLSSGTLMLYINPTGLGAGAAPSSAATSSYTFGAMELGQFGLATGDSTFVFDELRVGTTWADVSPIENLPEPSSGLSLFRSTHNLASNGSQDLEHTANDGVSNLLKYAFNMLGVGTGQAATLAIPNVASLASAGSAGLPFASMSPAPISRLELTFIRRKASSNPGVSYTVEFSNDLGLTAPWATNPSATETVVSLDPTFERVTVTDSLTAGTARFARVRVSKSN